MTTDGLPLFNLKPSETSQPQYWTVTELTSKIKGAIEPGFRKVYLRGEISNLRPAASGHVYFSIKDVNASISAAIFGGHALKSAGAGFKLKDGLEVLCVGKVSVYAPRGSYQLIVEQIEPLGAGALQVAFEQLKAKLLAEGLFDPKRKRALPRFPQHISVITSPTGSVIRDILNILSRRAPHIRVSIIPAMVQGDGAEQQLIRALDWVNREKIGEIVILARGGGSLEDLWCFNSEGLARKIAASTIPVVSAVGHETDVTIADFVADLRAPTPSAAAEIVSGSWMDVQEKLADANSRLWDQMRRSLEQRQILLDHVSARLTNPREKLIQQEKVFEEVKKRLLKSIFFHVEKKRAGFDRTIAQLDALSPLRVLDRGYSLMRADVQADTSTVIKSKTQLKKGDHYRVTFKDGDAKVQAL